MLRVFPTRNAIQCSAGTVKWVVRPGELLPDWQSALSTHFYCTVLA